MCSDFTQWEYTVAGSDTVCADPPPQRSGGRPPRFVCCVEHTDHAKQHKKQGHKDGAPASLRVFILSKKLLPLSTRSSDVVQAYGAQHQNAAHAQGISWSAAAMQERRIHMQRIDAWLREQIATRAAWQNAASR